MNKPTQRFGLIALLLALPFSGFAQSVSALLPVESAGTFTPISSPDYTLGSATMDNQEYVDPASPTTGSAATGPGFALGFTVTINGVSFNKIGISTNGHATLGSASSATMTVSTAYGAVSPTPPAGGLVLAPLAADLQGQVGAAIYLKSQGTAPNREYIVEWNKVKRYGSSGTGDTFTFQLRILESGDISYVYNKLVTTSTTASAQVGIRSSVDFTNATGVWGSVLQGSAATGTFNYTGGITSGKTITWPVPSCPPASLAITTKTPTSVNFSISSFTGTTYEIEYGAAGFTQGSGTVVAAGSTGSITGLMASTCYDIYVRNNCSASSNGYSSWVGPINVCTPCLVQSMPFTEGFGTWPPLCYTYDSGDEDWIHNLSDAQAQASYWNFSDKSFILESAPISINVPARVVMDWSHLANTSYPFDSLTVRVRSIGSTAWTNVVSLKGSAFNTPGATSTGPAALFSHEIAYLPSAFVGDTIVLQVYGWSDFGPNAYVDFVTVEAQPACPEPLQLGVSSVTDVTANLNWQSGASGFVVQWGPAGFSIGTGSSDTVATNSAVATGLAPNSSYDFYVMTLCGGAGNSIWSGPFSFTTLCAGFTLPTGYSENFDALLANEQPECWTPYGGATFTVPAFPGTTAYSAPNYAQMYTGGTVNAGIISPMFSDLDSGIAQVRFRAHKVYTWTNTNLVVGLVSTPSNPASFIPVDTITLNANWDEYTIPFPVVPAGYRHVAFRTTGTFNYAGFDDFYYEVQPACLPAINGSASAAATSAVVSWAHGVAGTPGSVVAWGPAGFNPGTGIILNQATVNSTSFTINGLAPNTPYTVWIADSCGANNLSPWFGPINFTTSCLGTSMPYVENFDVSPLGCWDNAGGTKTMMQYSQGAGFAMRGNFWSWTSGNYAVMTSRPVSITAAAQATFDWSHKYMSSYSDDQLLLLGKTTTATGWDTLVNLIGPNFNSPGAGTTVPGTFVDTTVYLPTSWVGSDAIFRFVANSDYGPDVFFDNFVVEAIPTCPEPIASVVAGSVSTTSGTISWSAPSGTQLGSNVFWGPVGFWQGTGAGVGGTTAWGVTSPYTITGLQPGQSYHIYVQDSCAANDQSSWAGPYTITMALCPPANKCNTYMYMRDSYGDGWNGGIITAQQKISGSWVTVKDFTFTAGSATQDIVQFCAGDSVLIIVTSGGSYANEMAFDLVGSNGDTLATMPFNSTLIAGSTWSSFIAQCTPCAVPTGLNVTSSTTCSSTTVTWTSGSSAVSTNLEYGSAGFTPGSGTSLTGLTGGTTTLSGLMPNTAYDVYVQDVCASGTSPWSSVATVTTANLPTVGAGADLAVCIGSVVTLSGSGASTYSWNNNITNGTAFTPTATSTYTVTGTDANGCVNVDSVVVTVNALPTVGAGADVAVCAGTSVTLSGSGAATYTWTNNITNATAFNPTATATYMVTGTDANGCVNLDSVVVTVNALPTVGAGANLAVCAGTSVTLSGSGASTYTWNNNITDATAITPTGTSTYTVTGTDANGCVNVDSVVVTVNALPTVGAGVDVTVCAGTPVTLSGSGAATYTWTNNVINGTAFTPTATTTYTVTGTDANGCVNLDSLVVTVNAMPDTTVTVTGSLAFCPGGSVSLSAASGLSYLWNTGDTTQSVVLSQSDTTYTVVTTVNGCVDTTASFTTLLYPGADTTLTWTNLIFCASDSATITAAGGQSYAWNTGDTTLSITINQTGSYSVTVTTVNGCVGVTDTVSTTVVPDVVLPQIIGDLYGWFASGDTVNFSVMNTGGYSLNWGITGGAITGGQSGDTISVVWGAADSTASIWVVVSNGVCQDSAYLNLVISGMGSGEKSSARAMAYPNPNAGVFTLEWSNMEAQQVVIYNGVGQVVASQAVDQSSSTAQVDLSTKAAGIYRAVIYGKDGQVTLPVQVRH